MSGTRRTDYGARTAERWRRLIAVLLDLALLGYAAFLAALMVVDLGDTSPAELLDGSATPPSALGPIPIAVVAALLAAGLAWCWHRFGGSPGMLLMGCEVVDSRTGARLSLPRAAWRVVALVIALVPLGLGYLWFLADGKRQGLHDKLARSDVVIEDESRLSLDELMGKVS